MKPRPWAMVAATVALAACTTTTTTTSTNTTEREARMPAGEQGDPDRRAQLRLELAALYFERGQGTTALDEIGRALAARPDLAPAYGLRGLVYASLGEPDLADESFRRALQLAPRDGSTMQNYGWFLCQQRRHADADAMFARALALPQYRDGARTLLAQGVCQARAGQWVEAERTLSHAYELDPSNPVAAYNLADVLLHRGQLERARFYVGRINSVADQVTAQSLWLAARIERQLGNTTALAEHGRRLRERFPDSTETLQYERGRFDD